MMKGGATASDFQERRLSRAVEHVSKHWLPYNPAVLAAVRQGVEEGRYELGTEFLLADLKQDLGLFSYFLREVVAQKRRHDPTITLTSPELCFRGIDSSQILELLSRAEKALASHSLSATKDAQAAHLKFTLISAATAEVLASRTQIDSETAFLSAMFRQLGLLLVAWNYPTVYERVQRTLVVGESLDHALSRQLGFSPEMIGYAVLQDYSLNPDLDAAVKSGSSDAKHLVVSKSAAQLAEICRVGEALAQANDPEHYPAPRSTWDDAKQILSQALGPDGLKLIRDALTRYGSKYREEFPELFASVESLDPERHQERAERSASLESNPFIDRCPLHIRQRLASFYAWLHQAQDPRAAVSRVLKEVVPVTGFAGGMILTIEPSRMELVPRLRFGEIVLRRVAPLRFGDRHGGDDPLLAALVVPTPFVSRAEGGARAYAVGGLGGDQPLGIFYAECAPDRPGEDDFDFSIVFKAVLRAFEDALGLRSPEPEIALADD